MPAKSNSTNRRVAVRRVRRIATTENRICGTITPATVGNDIKRGGCLLDYRGAGGGNLGGVLARNEQRLVNRSGLSRSGRDGCHWHDLHYWCRGISGFSGQASLRQHQGDDPVRYALRVELDDVVRMEVVNVSGGLDIGSYDLLADLCPGQFHDVFDPISKLGCRSAGCLGGGDRLNFDLWCRSRFIGGESRHPGANYGDAQTTKKMISSHIEPFSDVLPEV